jgi:hypothetical protein
LIFIVFNDLSFEEFGSKSLKMGRPNIVDLSGFCKSFISFELELKESIN